MECDWTTEILGSTAPWQRAGDSSLSAPEVGGALSREDQRRLESHLEGCAACAAYAGELARLDTLLLSEPVPAPPPDLSAAILREVALRRRAELAWARGRSLAAVAALLVLAGLVFGLSEAAGLGPLAAEWSATDWDLSLRAWERLEGALAQVRASLDALAGGVAARGAPASSPGGLWGPLLALAPILLLFNWAVGRGSLHSRLSA